jgi:hypothetical protein
MPVSLGAFPFRYAVFVGISPAITQFRGVHSLPNPPSRSRYNRIAHQIVAHLVADLVDMK